MERSKKGYFDIDISALTRCKSPVIHKTSHVHIHKYKDRFAAKVPAGERELEMMLYAGPISITPQGRVLKDGDLVGILMDLGEPIDVSALDLPFKRELANQIVNLITELHKKGLLHGDVKLANVLRAPDGSVRLCDFEGAEKEPCVDPPSSLTLNWTSPARLRNPDVPLCRADDLYALGLTIWEVFTGRIPFEGLEEGDVECKIMANETVDLSEIPDISIRVMIEGFLREGTRIY